MSKPGFSVMVNALFGTSQFEAVRPYLGQQMTALQMDDKSLRVTFSGGVTVKLYDDGQSCCESRYMRTDDTLADYVGATLQDVELRDAPPIEDEYGDHEVQFLALRTDRGVLTFSNHNEHNGYYGGFWLRAEVEP